MIKENPQVRIQVRENLSPVGIQLVACSRQLDSSVFPADHILFLLFHHDRALIAAAAAFNHYSKCLTSKIPRFKCWFPNLATLSPIVLPKNSITN